MLAKRDVVLANEYLGFVLLSLFDLFLTGYIFKHGGEEANGLFGWVLRTWHLVGFAIAKFVFVAFIVVICEVIAMFNPARAKMVILGGCALYVLVVIWECWLIFQRIDPAIHASQGAAAIISVTAAPIDFHSAFSVPAARGHSA